jgi:hypothetical protein
LQSPDKKHAAIFKDEDHAAKTPQGVFFLIPML